LALLNDGAILSIAYDNEIAPHDAQADHADCVLQKGRIQALKAKINLDKGN
jgi:hypothetical protein